MEWIYADNELPKSREGKPPVCLVSIRGYDGDPYVDFAIYDEEEKLWLDTSREMVLAVYAWCLPVPAKDLGY